MAFTEKIVRTKCIENLILRNNEPKIWTGAIVDKLLHKTARIHGNVATAVDIFRVLNENCST